MAWYISKRFTFSASHQLAHLPATHKCSRLHGHNYSVEVELRAQELDQDGFVIDYAALEPFRQWVHQALDHRDLNQVLQDPRATTAEALASMLYMAARAHLPREARERGVKVSRCTVKETDATSATYAEDPA